MIRTAGVSVQKAAGVDTCYYLHIAVLWLGLRCGLGGMWRAMDGVGLCEARDVLVRVCACVCVDLNVASVEWMLQGAGGQM